MCVWGGGGGALSGEVGRRVGSMGSVIYNVSLTLFQVLRSLRHNLRAQSQGHHTIDRLEERGVERGSAR